jgi:hypothetical protein
VDLLYCKEMNRKDEDYNRQLPLLVNLTAIEVSVIAEKGF